MPPIHISDEEYAELLKGYDYNFKKGDLVHVLKAQLRIGFFAIRLKDFVLDYLEMEYLGCGGMGI